MHLCEEGLDPLAKVHECDGFRLHHGPSTREKRSAFAFDSRNGATRSFAKSNRSIFSFQDSMRTPTSTLSLFAVTMPRRGLSRVRIPSSLSY